MFKFKKGLYMISYNIFIISCAIIAAISVINYANYEIQQKNKTSAFTLYAIALVSVSLSVLQCFF